MTSPVELWPPLALIRRGLTQERPAAATPIPAAPRDAQAPPVAPAPDTEALLLPLTELARRREALAQRAFGAHWASGRLLSVRHGCWRLGVLLDRPLAAATGAVPGWQGWLVAGEADWAGPFDVLLEPQDEPFEPAWGVVQTWNPVELHPSALTEARVQGELSASRMAAVRAVAAQAACGDAAPPASLGLAARPGRIALREVAGFGVLTGTPLAAQGDPRSEHQALYREAAQALLAARPARADAAARPAAPAGRQSPGWGARLRGWLGLSFPAGGAGLWRPAAAVLALVVVVQNAGLLPAEPDDVRLRGGPAAVPTAPLPAAPDLRLRWRDGTGVAEATALLQRADAQVIGGPDADGFWALRLQHPRDGQRVLQSSPLVDVLVTPP
ncbi:hypothetical protein [Xenophilus sp. Marseille-Q4582]|uniref:hypothetical protein n=1 Tax=Xenophilus sp. Marseille-Q4582 TaxID=2866600 RepID=UPI001CE47E61|nr:hypothetical protein [Xenophilus sp. Marseille-Q4582]